MKCCKCGHDLGWSCGYLVCINQECSLNEKIITTNTTTNMKLCELCNGVGWYMDGTPTNLDQKQCPRCHGTGIGADDIPPIFRGNESSNGERMPTDPLMLKGLDQPLSAVCEALRDQGKGEFAKSLEDIYRIAQLVPKYELALWECIKLSGHDTSRGPATWPTIDVCAVREVRRMRDENDEEENFFLQN